MPNSKDVATTLQERYLMLIGTLGQVNVEVKNPNVDAKELDRLIEAVKMQMVALQTTKKTQPEQESTSSIYTLASLILSENKPTIDGIMATIGITACEASGEFNLASFKNALVFGLSRPGFITISPSSTPASVKVDLNTNKILGTPAELQQMILETRAVMKYGGKVSPHMADAFWFMDYSAAREGVVPYKTTSFKKLKTYRKYGFKRTKVAEMGGIGSKVRVPDEARFRRGIAFYNRVVNTRLELSKGKALFWYLLEHGTRAIAKTTGINPYPEFGPTRFVETIKKVVEEFIYTKLMEQYPSTVFKERAIVGEDYGKELDRLIKLRDDLIDLKQSYMEILLGVTPEKAYRQKFRDRIKNVVESIDTELETKFSKSQLRENIALARAERGLLRAVSGEVAPNYRVYLGVMEGKEVKKRLTLLTRGIQATLPQEQEKLMRLLSDMKIRLKELDIIILDNMKALENIRRIRRR